MNNKLVIKLSKFQLQREIITSGKSGDIDKFCKLIEQGADPFRLDKYNKSAAAYAAAANPAKIKELSRFLARFAYNYKSNNSP